MGAGVIPVRFRVINDSRPGRSDGGSFAVQLGAFLDEARAVALQRRVATDGTEVKIEPTTVGDRRIYRVRVGGFTSREHAAAEARRLATRGHSTRVLQE